MLSFLYKMFALALLFIGGYLSLRYGMNQEEQLSRIVAFIVMPVLAFVVWFVSFRGKKFK
jgi:hypothetical protein